MPGFASRLNSSDPDPLRGGGGGRASAPGDAAGSGMAPPPEMAPPPLFVGPARGPSELEALLAAADAPEVVLLDAGSRSLSQVRYLVSEIDRRSGAEVVVLLRPDKASVPGVGDPRGALLEAGAAEVVLGAGDRPPEPGDPEVLRAVTDARSRHRHRQRVRAEGRLFRTLAENLSETVVVIRTNGSLLYASPSFRELAGIEPGAALGQNAFAFIHPEDREAALCSVRMVAEGTHPPGPVTFRVPAPDGTLRILEASGKNLLGHPDVQGIVVSFRDVSDRVAMEARLLAAEKLEALGRLAGGIAHDFNNILTALAGNTEMLLEDVGPEDPLRQGLEESQRAIQRAAGLTGRLLAFSRPQMMVFEVTRLDDVVREVEGLLRRVLESHIDLALELSDCGRVRVDVNQLEQVILNLVLNARDAMPRGGSLRILVEPVELTASDAARFPFPVQPGPYSRLSVSDTGHGMDEGVLARLFEPFFTTKPAGQGTGLGLATAYAFAKQSLGYLVAESTPSRGSTFRLYLPRVTEEEPGA